METLYQRIVESRAFAESAGILPFAVLEKMIAHPWVVGILAVLLVISASLFWSRVRRENRNRRERTVIT